jgi:ABC-type transport system substrate-binding protein
VEPKSLVLAHPASALARAACQSIRLQLTAVGIPVELSELTGDQPQEFDLLYAELVFQEPLVDAGRLLGPGGLAGYCGPTMATALEDVMQATTWNDLRARLRQVHQTAHDELPVVPLWQTVNYLAHVDSLKGVVDQPAALYQDAASWRSVAPRAGGNR